MPTKARQALHRRTSQFNTLDGFERSYKPEITCRERRKKQQTNVSRGCSVGNTIDRVLLKIIGRQPMLGFAYKSFKITPSAPRRMS